jgi:hypothetical protein
MVSRHHPDMLRKRINKTKAVEASAFVSSKMYFSQHINRGKCFALFAKHIICCEKELTKQKQ